MVKADANIKIIEEFEEIRKSEALLARLLENSSQPFGVGYPDGRLGLVNKAFEELTGYSREELKSTNWSEILTPHKFRDMENEKLLELQRTGQPVRYEKEYIRKDGTRLPIELLVHLKKNKDGTPEYYYSFITNISERKHQEVLTQKLLESEQQLTEELQTSNEELQSTSEELHVKNEELKHQGDNLLQINKALKESEERFRTLSDNIPNLAWMADANGWTFWYNKQWYEYTGTTLDEMQGWGWQKVHHPDYVKPVTEEWSTRIKEGKPYDNIFPLKSKDGKYRWFLTRVTPIRDDQGKLIRWLGTNTDITERKEVETELNKYKDKLESLVEVRTAELEKAYKSLKESEEHYLTLFNSIDEGFCTIEVIFDSNNNPIDHRFLEINPAFAKQTGLEDAEGKLMRDLAPDNEEHWFEIYGEIALTGKPMRFVNEAKALNRWYDVYAFKIGAPENREIAILFNDITKFKKTEEALEFSSIYNRSLIDASLDPLVTIGPDGKITDVNKSTEIITGYSKDVLIGTDFSDYFTEPEKARSGYKQVFKEGSVYDYSLEIKSKTGEVTPVLYNASIYKDKRGEVIGVFAAARDITQIKRVENKLKEYQDTLEEKVKKRTEELAISNAELEHFAYVASHDLREPLRMITSFLQLLERRYGDNLDQDASEFIGFAVDGAKRLDDMINDLLEYSKVNRKEQVFRSVNLEKVLESALINLIIPTEENNAVIGHDPLPTVYGDEKLLVQLFQNLIGNAIKYHGQEPPKIHISSIKENNQYIISIKDNGIGIESQHLERIFTIFQRLHGNDEYEGTGIGLAITQKIVHQHNGNIWVESKQGKGSTFYFTIPIK